MTNGQNAWRIKQCFDIFDLYGCQTLLCPLPHCGVSFETPAM